MGMEKVVPTGPQISEAAALFLASTTRGDITPERRGSLIRLASEMWTNTHMMHDMNAVHASLRVGDAKAGSYRQSVVLGEQAKIRLYPKSAAVPRLMKKYYYHAYEEALAMKKFYGHQPADVAWYIGAMGRCIRPFYYDNWAIFWLVENQLRIHFGLPISVEIRSKCLFDQFREEKFIPTFSECYVDSCV